MGDTIKARKGIKASIDPLLLGEFGFTTDEERLYIGGNNGNIPLPNAADLSEKANNTDIARTTTNKDVTGAINELNNVKANSISPTEINLTYINSLVADATYKNTYCKNSFNEVTIISRYKKSGTSNDIANGVQLFTLPSGYRPSKTIICNAMVCTLDNTHYQTDLMIYTDGVVTMLLPNGSLTYMIGQFNITFVGGN